MSEDPKKQEPKLGLEMSFGETLERFLRTDPKEVAESVARSRTKRPSGDPILGRPTCRQRGELSPDRKRKPDSSG